MDKYQLFHGDCLDILPSLEDKSIDAIITDLPYGTTDCEWDSIIDLDKMWKEVKRTLKDGGVFITTGSQPFTSILITSNIEWFKYEWIWDKDIPGNPLIAKYQPLKVHENILVFSKETHIYNPQKIKGKRRTTKTAKSKMWNLPSGEQIIRNEYEPRSILEISNANRNGIEHPTQKPLPLYEYLVLTYTNKSNIVMDFCMGSGTAGVACMKLDRQFIGIEKEKNYFDIAEKRIKAASQQMNMFTDV